MCKKWWQRGPAHWTRICHAHCRSGTQEMAFQNFSSSSNRSCAKRATNSRDPTGVPKKITPHGLQTSGPNSSIPSGHNPPRFHVRVFALVQLDPCPLVQPGSQEIVDEPDPFWLCHDKHIVQESEQELSLNQSVLHYSQSVAKLNNSGMRGSPCSPPSCCRISCLCPCWSSQL